MCERAAIRGGRGLLPQARRRAQVRVCCIMRLMLLACQIRPCDIAAIGSRKNRENRTAVTFSILQLRRPLSLQHQGPEAVLPNQGPEAGQHAHGRAEAALPEDLRLRLRAPLRPEARPGPLRVPHRVRSKSHASCDGQQQALATCLDSPWMPMPMGEVSVCNNFMSLLKSASALSPLGNSVSNIYGCQMTAAAVCWVGMIVPGCYARLPAAGGCQKPSLACSVTADLFCACIPQDAGVHESGAAATTTRAEGAGGKDAAEYDPCSVDVWAALVSC